MEITIKALPLIRLANAAGTEQKRVYLHCVRIEPAHGGAIAVATNGSILAAQFEPGVEIEKAVGVTLTAIAQIKRSLTAALRPIGRQFQEHLAITFDAERFTLFDSTSSAARKFTQSWAENPFMADDFTFTEWRRVVPRIDDAAKNQYDVFNPTLIEQLASTIPGKEKCIQLHQNKLGDPAIMCGAENWLGVIMPMRIKPESSKPAPEWLFPPETRLHAVA